MENNNFDSRPIDQLWQAYNCLKALSDLTSAHSQMDTVNGDNLALLISLVAERIETALQSLDNKSCE